MPGTSGDGALPTYVHVARRLANSGSSITLIDLAPATLVIGGPVGAVGYLATGQFLDVWYAEAAGAATHAAEAVLSLLGSDHVPHLDVRLLVRLPRIHGSGLQYQMIRLVGELPSAGGGCVLFVNPPATLTTASTTNRAVAP
jgi:hypothetical protein